MPDSITVLQSSGPRMAKLIRPGKPIESYEDARHFNAVEVPVTGLDDLRSTLAKLIAFPTRFVVRGSLITPGPARGIQRRLHPNAKTGELPTLKTVPQSWLALDLDEVPLPAGADITDLKACGRAAVTLLYPEFHGARCLVQATGSHGLKPGARLRLWYWLSRPVGDRELKAWLGDLPVDVSIFGAAQPIFTAAPVFADGAREHLPRRLDELPGAPAVEVPAEIYVPTTTTSVAGAEAQAPIEDVQSALMAMANDDRIDWVRWNEIGMAAWRASGGDQDGLNAWTAWSEKNPKHDPFACEARWLHFHESPPTSIGFGTLAYLARQANPTWRPPSKPRVAPEDEFDAEDLPAPANDDGGDDGGDDDGGGGPSWQGQLERTDRGIPKAHLANAVTAFSLAPDWRGTVRFNEFSYQIVMTKRPPIHWPDDRPLPDAVGDNDISETAIWLQKRDIDVASATAGEALRTVAGRRKFHPVRAYLNGLTWDGAPRIDTWLVDFMGAEDTALNRTFGAKFLISAVARVMLPGCKVDTVLVLEGEQGIKKSSALRTLAGEWFTDHIPDLMSKDALQQLHGVWIAEHAEFDQLGKAEANRAKAFISTAIDRFRPPYGRVAQDFKRQCVFAATINPSSSGYLRDETGGRRFWPVRCGIGWQPGRKVDMEALATARDQMWAEAKARHAAGEKWWLDDHMEEAAAVEASKRYDADIWTDDITAYLDGEDKKQFVTINEILQHVLNFTKGERDLTKRNRVGRVLRALNWKRGMARIGGKPTDGYKRPRDGAAADTTAETTNVIVFPHNAASAHADFSAEPAPGDAELAEMMA